MFMKKAGLILSMPLFAALTFGVLALAKNEPAPDTAAADARNDLNKPLAEALPISLRAGGFSPSELSRTAGDYYLSINNLSRVQGLTLRLSRENQGRVKEAKTSREKTYWREHVQLSPGTYLITEANHPDWVCRITVTAR
jgi:hypothetical protein